MSISTVRPVHALAREVRFDEHMMHVLLLDGREISVPLDWFPALRNATKQQRSHWRLIGKGVGVHWPDLDEDISVQNILLGQPSGESQESFKKWLSKRKPKGRPG